MSKLWILRSHQKLRLRTRLHKIIYDSVWDEHGELVEWSCSCLAEEGSDSEDEVSAFFSVSAVVVGFGESGKAPLKVISVDAVADSVRMHLQRSHHSYLLNHLIAQSLDLLLNVGTALLWLLGNCLSFGQRRHVASRKKAVAFLV